ncbi:four helix bundle protein [Pirellulaceae bacterium SH467]
MSCSCSCSVKRCSCSILLNIAEGNGKRSLKDRARFLDIARGSALECAAIRDVLVVSNGLSRVTDYELKSRLVRLVAMLTRMAMKLDGVSQWPIAYDVRDDCEHEHRPPRTEHEYDEEPEPADALNVSIHWHWTSIDPHSTGVILFVLRL